MTPQGHSYHSYSAVQCYHGYSSLHNQHKKPHWYRGAGGNWGGTKDIPAIEDGGYLNGAAVGGAAGWVNLGRAGGGAPYGWWDGRGW